MSAPPAPADTPSARRLAMLDRLAAIGMGMAEALNAEVEGAERPAQAAAEAAMGFARVSRAVRMTVMLAERIEAQVSRPQSGQDEAGRRGAAEDGAGEARVGPDGRSEQEVVQRVKTRMLLLSRKDEVRQLVERAIDAAHAVGREAGEAAAGGAAGRAETLRAELGARLESPDTDEREWLERPLGELARRVCAALGVGYDPRLWEGEADGPADAAGPDEAGGPAAAPRAPGRKRWPYWLAEGPAYASLRLRGTGDRLERGPP